MLLGVGYLPRRSGPAFWKSFDAAEIGDDLAHIAQIGFEAVRVPLFWADVQPGLEKYDPKVLDRFGHFLQLAEDHSLKVTAGLWAGFWDGALWWPDWGMRAAPLPPHWPIISNDQWVRFGQIRHPFTSDLMLEARYLLIEELVAYYGSHPALGGWEPMPGFGRLAAAAGRTAILDWLGDTSDRLQQAAPGVPATYLLALDALETDSSVWPGDIFEAGGHPSLSLATFASDRRRLPLSPRWIAFALDLTIILAGQPISLHLAGLPTAPAGEPSVAHDGVYYASEEEAGEHLADVLAIAEARECPSLWLWRWADIPEYRWNQLPYDRPNWRRQTGLLRADGSEKKLVDALPAGGSSIQLPGLKFDPDEYREDPRGSFQDLWMAYQQATARS